MFPGLRSFAALGMTSDNCAQDDKSSDPTIHVRSNQR